MTSYIFSSTTDLSKDTVEGAEGAEGVEGVEGVEGSEKQKEEEEFEEENEVLQTYLRIKKIKIYYFYKLFFSHNFIFRKFLPFRTAQGNPNLFLSGRTEFNVRIIPKHRGDQNLEVLSKLKLG